MNSQFSVLVKRYLIASLIVVIGLVMIVVGFKTSQDSTFKIAAFNLFIGGILALLFSAGILDRKLVLGIGVICLVIAGFIGYGAYQSVKTSEQHEKDYIKSERLNQYTLTQIRDIQRVYYNQKGVYAPSFDVLKDFFENDKIVKVHSSGQVPPRTLTIKERDFLYTDKRALDNNMTEREAALLVAGGNPGNSPDLENFVRDTILVSFKEEFLSSKSRSDLRKNLGLGEFNIDELRYIPMTEPKKEWIFDTRDDLVYHRGDTIATVRVYGQSAISRFEGGVPDTVGFGNINTNSDKGTWE